MNRRGVLLVLGVFAFPAAVLGQAGRKLWRIGIIVPTSRERQERLGRDRKVLQGMAELGYVKDRDFVTEWRYGEGSSDRLPALAAELVALKVDVIVASGGPAIRAVQHATKAIPIVMTNVDDPVARGFVASLARPGGNITGMSNSSPDVSPKYLELLIAVVPTLQRVAVLGTPPSSVPAIQKAIQVAAQGVRIDLISVDARTVKEIESAFATMARERAEALIVWPEPFLYQQARQISELAAKHRLPAVYGSREPVESGGLMGYGQNLEENWRRAAIYVDKIFKGAKPADLPVEQPTKFELVINLKTAKALGLTIPPSVLARADGVIQ